MDLTNLVLDIPGFASWAHTDKIKLFGWYLHTYRDMERFGPADIRSCYSRVHLEPSANISSQLTSLRNGKAKDVLSDRTGFRLSMPARTALDQRFGKRPATIQVDKMLSELPDKISAIPERAFLSELLIGFRHGAFRSAIVMCWNLAYDHLCNWILKCHLQEFNAQLVRSYPKSSMKMIIEKEDFEELKEFQVLQVCRSAQITTSGIHKILSQKLETRNSAAHPSNVVFSQLQTEEFISTLVSNVVLNLN